jgi:hypothetical protein
MIVSEGTLLKILILSFYHLYFFPTFRDYSHLYLYVLKHYFIIIIIIILNKFMCNKSYRDKEELRCIEIKQCKQELSATFNWFHLLNTNILRNLNFTYALELRLLINIIMNPHLKETLIIIIIIILNKLVIHKLCQNILLINIIMNPHLKETRLKFYDNWNFINIYIKRAQKWLFPNFLIRNIIFN